MIPATNKPNGSLINNDRGAPSGAPEGLSEEVTFKLRSMGLKEPGEVQADVGAGAKASGRKSVHPGSQREQTIVSKGEIDKY